MMKNIFTRKALTVVLIGGALSIAAVACGSDGTNAPAAGGDATVGTSVVPTPPPASYVKSSFERLKESLEAKYDVVIVRVGEERSGIFDTLVINTLFNGEAVSIYEFPSIEAAEKAAQTVSADGTTISSGDGPPVAIDFLNPPHYYAAENLIVVYTGRVAEVINPLRDYLGEFAGNTTPTEPGADFDTVLEPAPIESVEVVEDADEPGFFVLNVTSGLPNGCATFEDWSIKQTGELELTLTVLNRVPAPGELIACTEIYGFVNHTIPLGSADTNLDACEVYTVRWQSRGNDESLRFQVTAPNIRCADPGLPTDGDGPVVAPIIADIDAFILGLRAAGVDVERSSEKGSEIFGFTSQVVMVNGERVELFSYGPGDGSLVAASGVSLDGTSFNLGPKGPIVSVNWLSQPHLYLAGNSIVLYVGTDDDVISALDAATGQKFAGPGATAVELPLDDVTPLPLPGSPDLVTVPAPIVSVEEVVIAESFPPQYFLKVTSAQPNGCDRDAGWEVDIEQTEIRVTVLNTQPADLSVVLCAAIYGETVHTVALGSAELQSGVEYSLFVNEVSYGSFVAQ